MYRIVKLLAALAYLAAGIGGLLLCVRFVAAVLGTVAAIAAVLLSPLTLAVVPWLAAVRNGDWTLLAAVYGGVFLAAILHALARALERGAKSEIRKSGAGSRRGRRPGGGRSRRDSRTRTRSRSPTPGGEGDG